VSFTHYGLARFHILKKKGVLLLYLKKAKRRRRRRRILWKLKIYFSMQKYAKYIYTYLKKAKI
jgi:hypothetical protein